MKETEDTDKWNSIACSWIGRINIVKMSVLPKCHIHIQCNPYVDSSDSFFIIRKDDLKIHMKPQNTPNSQRNPKKEKLIRRHHTLISRCMIKLVIKNQHSIGRETDKKTNEPESRAQK